MTEPAPKFIQRVAQDRQVQNRFLTDLADILNKRAAALRTLAELGNRLPPRIRLRVLDVLRSMLHKLNDLIVKLEA